MRIIKPSKEQKKDEEIFSVNSDLCYEAYRAEIKDGYTRIAIGLFLTVLAFCVVASYFIGKALFAVLFWVFFIEILQLFKTAIMIEIIKNVFFGFLSLSIGIFVSIYGKMIILNHKQKE